MHENMANFAVFINRDKSHMHLAHSNLRKPLSFWTQSCTCGLNAQQCCSATVLIEHNHNDFVCDLLPDCFCYTYP